MPLRKNRGALIKNGRLKPGLQRRRTLRKNREALIKDGRLKPGLQRRRTLRKNREALIKNGRLKPGLQRRRTLRKNREALIKNGRLKPGLQRRRTLRKNREALIKNGRLKPGLQRRGPSRKNRGALTKNAHGPWRGNTRPDRRKDDAVLHPMHCVISAAIPGAFGPKARRFAQPAHEPEGSEREDAASWFYVRAPVGRLPFFGSSVSGCRFRPPSHQARNASEGPRWRFALGIAPPPKSLPSCGAPPGSSLALRAWYRTQKRKSPFFHKLRMSCHVSATRELAPNGFRRVYR